MATIDIILQGGGEHARVVLDCLLAQQASVVGIFDPKYSGELFGVKQLGSYDPSFKPEARAVVAIGNNELRKHVSLKTRHTFTNAVHPSAVISPFAALGVGCMVLHGSIIQAQSEIGNHVIVNTGAKVDHDCLLEDFVHIAPGAILCGTVTVGEGSLVGAGAVVLPGKKIGKWATVGAGSVVISDIPDYAVCAGNPASVINQKKK